MSSISRLFLWLFTTAVVSAGVFALAEESIAITLTSAGAHRCCIVVARDAILPEKTAARELQTYLKQVTGAVIPIKNEPKAGTPSIFVGQSSRVGKILPDVDWKTLRKDGIVIRTIRNDLVLAGGRPRGTIYAVYTFLEDIVGCRWWTSTESYIPKRPTLRIGALNIKYTPKLIYREAYYADTNENPGFAPRLKLNGHFARIPAKYGGHYNIIGWCHTFYTFIPPDKYFADHPEWFSEINGKRTGDKAQLCLTNKELVQEMARVAKEKIKEKPDAGIISISQNDWGGKCECEKCKALEEREGSPSGPIIHFVNAVAAEIEKEYPDVLVETLAYLYSRKPPLHVKPRKNVLIRLCTIDCNFAQPFDSDMNKAFRDDIEKWASIAPNLYIWDYVTNFGNAIPPHANMHILAPNLRLFVKNNAVGVFEQGDATCYVGDFVRLRAWVLAHLMWDPSRDEKKLFNEFLNGYYGAAGPYIAKYINVIHDAVRRKDIGFGCIHGNVSFWNLQEMNEATDYLNKAEKAVAGDPVLARRVQRDRMPVDLLWLLRYDELKQASETAGLPFAGPKDPAAAARQFLGLIRKWNVTRSADTQPIESLTNLLIARFLASSPPTPSELSSLPSSSVIVVQENDFWYGKQGIWSDVVDDAKASNGKAAFMPANHAEWAVKYFVPEGFADGYEGPWNCYAVIRCDALAETGPAVRYGVVDNLAGYPLISGEENLKRLGNGEYFTCWLGTQRLNSSCYFWFSPAGNPDVVKGIYIDRLVLEKDIR